MKYLVLVLTTTISSFSCFAQSLPLPNAVQFEGIPKDVTEIVAGGEEGLPDVTIITRLHPIGWSKDGKLASSSRASRNGFCLQVYIQDMVSDKILWSSSLCADDVEKNEKKARALSAADIWAKMGAESTQMLVKYRIIPSEKIDFRRGDWHRLNGQAYKFDLIDNVADGEGGFLFQVECRAKGMGKKMVMEGAIGAMFTDIAVAGIITSPYEDRVAIIYQFTEGGHENHSSLSDFEITGCHLKQGFK